MRDSNEEPLLEGATATLAAFAADMRFDDLSAAAVARLKTSLLDSIGCCLYGMTLPWTQQVQAMVEAEQATPVSALFGTGRATSAAGAVLVNGTAGHAFELDDIHKESILHPGSIALPVAAALAQARGSACSGKQFLTALACGYELGIRVGNAATMNLFFRGFHPQGTSGVFVATATAGWMLGLDARQMQHALGIAGSQAGGLMAAQEGAMVKRLHAGRAAQSGVYAAQLAQRGFTGIGNVLEAAYGGYLSSYSDQPNADRLTQGLGHEWEIEKVGYKPHASVTSIHAAMDALRELMDSHALDATDIALVRVGVSHMTYVHCAWPYQAQGVTAAQMNLFFGLAVIALDGVAFVAQYDEDRLADPAILAFIQRIEASADPGINAMGAAYRHAARVEITTRDGKRLHHEILHRRGSPENPLSAYEVEQKFRNVAAGCLAPSAMEQIIQQVESIERMESVASLLELLAAERPAEFVR
ncbi:MmgE/PrpD family protein (plasmid) [Diaphorobacter sp. HDW4B]|uniref:MmgE/PrpD family protein n=1 Tax=Diaphorobacter sp. HDW4B TaxID=2714925 RepID=UPI0014092288|nr:MmgE/PrpD family protein [Diaphorobacter sp. HDW4B]QIL73798.1 MmgE/PrpD family protein [Diaphorobacter sp. HDW4B]